MKILVINPGSTSTKISLYEDKKCIFDEDVFHDAPELLQYKTVNDQIPFRKQLIKEILNKYGYDIKQIDAYAARGGSAYSQKAGVIEIDERLYLDTLNAVGGSEHPAKLGVCLAYELCKEYGGKMYTLNATNVDEFNDVARLTGIKGVYRFAQAHVLNQKAVGNKYAETIGTKYENLNLIICHIDGGITITAHNKGRMIDSNVGAGGDGPFTPTRIGSVPVLSLLDYLEKHSIDEVRKMCSRSGGFVSYFNTSDGDVIHNKVLNGDKNAKLVWDSMVYNIIKETGAMSAVLKGKVDAIILTGGYVRFNDLVEEIKNYCEYIAPIYTYLGELEQETLALEIFKVMNGETAANKYTGEPAFKGFEGIDF